MYLVPGTRSITRAREAAEGETETAPLFERLCNRDRRDEFLLHRSRRMRACDLDALTAYIQSDDCTKDLQALLAGTFDYPLPRQVQLRKSHSERRRTVFVYPERQNNLMKYLTWGMLEYDGVFSESLFSFRKSKGVSDVFRNIVRAGYVRNLYVAKADVHDYGYSIKPALPQGVDGYAMLTMAAVMYLTAGFIKLCVQTTKTFMLSNLRLRIAGQVEASVMAHILLLPQHYFADKSAGKVSKRLSAARQISDRLLNMVLNLGLTAVFSLGYIPQMMTFAPALVLPAIVMLVIRSLFAVLVAVINVRNETASMQADIDASGLMFSALKGAQKIRTMGAERRLYARWAGIYQRVLKYDLDQPFILKAESEISTFLASCTALILISIVAGSDLSRGDYIAFNASYSLVVAAISELF